MPTRKGVRGREAGWVKQPHLCEANRASRCETPYFRAQRTSTQLSKNSCLNMTNVVVSFAQDYQALSLRKYRQFISKFCFYRRTRSFRFIEAVETPQDASEQTENSHRKARKMLQSRGLKRIRRDILATQEKSALKARRSLGYGSTLFIPSYNTSPLLPRHFSNIMACVTPCEVWRFYKLKSLLPFDYKCLNGQF